MSPFIPTEEFLVYDTEHWRISQRVDATLPGYLVVAAKDTHAVDLAGLPPGALSQLGYVLSMSTSALQTCLHPEHIHVCRFGHDASHAVHFHVIPIYSWVKEAYHRAVREGGTEVTYPDFIDGASLTLFVTEEFRSGRAPCEIVGPNIKDVIQELREALSRVAAQQTAGADL